MSQNPDFFTSIGRMEGIELCLRSLPGVIHVVMATGARGYKLKPGTMAVLVLGGDHYEVGALLSEVHPYWDLLFKSGCEVFHGKSRNVSWFTDPNQFYEVVGLGGSFRPESTKTSSIEGARAAVESALLIVPGVTMVMVLDCTSGFTSLKPGEVAVAVIGNYSQALVGIALYEALVAGVVTVSGTKSLTYHRVSDRGMVPVSSWFTSFKDLFDYLGQEKKVTAVPFPVLDPLDVEVDGILLRDLLNSQKLADQGGYRFTTTPSQREALSSHWSAQLREKVSEGESEGRKMWKKENARKEKQKISVQENW